MISHTNSFKILKENMQEVFDFAISVCYSVPALKRSIKELENKQKTSLETPDHFDPSRIPVEKVKTCTSKYKQSLSKFLLLNSFCYESYVIDVLDEILSFHDAKDNLDSKKKAAQESLARFSGDKDKRKLQEMYNPQKRMKYIKHSRLLRDKGFKFPTELFFLYGLHNLKRKLNQENIRAVEIPELLAEALLIKIDQSKIEEFKNCRDIRNKIAHGKPQDLNLRKVVALNHFLRELALEVDAHIIENFFILEV
jgi:hypothetical protein